MDLSAFINNYREAFGEKAPLPIIFYYSNQAIAETKKINGCLFKEMEAVRSGKPISLNAEIIGCGGGKLYTGFGPMNEYIPNFVSQKERYKQNPQDVIAYVDSLQLQSFTGKYLNFVRIDQMETLDDIEGMLFFATPDIFGRTYHLGFFRQSFGRCCFCYLWFWLFVGNKSCRKRKSSERPTYIPLIVRSFGTPLC